MITGHSSWLLMNIKPHTRQRLRDKRTTAPTYGLMVRICRLLVVGGILAMDVFATFLTPDSNTSYEAHLTGALVGLLVGLVVLRNRRVEHWERWAKAMACASVVFLLLLLGGFHLASLIQVDINK